MKEVDYKCLECGEIITHFFEDTEEIPSEISITCIHSKKSCHGIAKRIYSPLYSIIYQGKAGNYKNGYTSNQGYIKKT